MSSENFPPVNDIETALSAWSPQPVQVDRDRLMFAAGEAVGRNYAELVPAYNPPRGKRLPTLWQVATCLSTAAAIFLALMLWQERGERVVVAEVESTQEESVVGDEDALLEAPSPILAHSAAAEGAGPTIAPRSLPVRQFAEGTYLAKRHRMLTTPVERWPTATQSLPAIPRERSPSDEPRKPATMRNLLDEYLPREIRSDDEFGESVT